MAITFSTANMPGNKWVQLYDASNMDIPAYMSKNYGARLSYKDEGLCDAFIFPSKEKYVEFVLRWL